ncbi:PIN domain-containing protein [Candidatus Peregrinibacteria bacterium]|nr:PIN domain-containing protein [Candidatus Peregrinibacteria bacterium]
MTRYLLDTNIVIYILKNDTGVMNLISRYSGALFFISIVTWIETLGGSFHHGKNIHELAHTLEVFYRIPIHEKIAILSANLIQSSALKKQKLRFQDTVIAATAITENIPLITNNPKDFRHFKGLKIISPN